MEESVREMLGGDLRRIADVAGLEAAIKISRAMRGTTIYIPSLDEIERLARDERIRHDYHIKGYSARRVAMLHEVTERAVWKILNRISQNLSPETLEILNG
jgi:Mor family transcriptional regulator